MFCAMFTPLFRHALARVMSGAVHRSHVNLWSVLAVVVALLSVSLSSFAAVDPLARLTLVWEAPGNCPERSVLEGKLRRDLAASDVTPAPLRVEVRIMQQSNDRFVVSMVTEGAAGQSRRTLEAKTCGELVNATSLIIATLIDPEAVAQHSQEPSHPGQASMTTAQTSTDTDTAVVAVPRVQPASPAPNGVAAPNQPTTAKPAARLEGAARGRTLGILAGWADLDVGSLPSPAVAVGGLLGWETDGLRIEAQAGWWRPESTTWDRSPNPQAGARFEMIAAEFKACRRAYRLAWFGLYPCAGVEYRQMTGQANEFVTEPGQATRRGLAPSFSALATVALARQFAIRAVLGTVFPLARPEFTIDGLGVLHQPSRVTLRAGIGLEARFP